MRSAPADRARLRLRRSTRWSLAAAVVVGAALTGCQSDDPYVAPAPTASSDAIQPSTAAATLDDL
ncbi:hypothetical protein, partial [Nocardioides stalactiti]|uniref:hypothetical protein n=1 Tax=Nocardioides stalactiti TaxID=2755356 RepID=UPI001C7E90A9